MIMKTKLLMGATLLFGASALAQEYDDMYFRSKDREKLSTSNTLKDTYSSDNYSKFKKKHFDEVAMLDDYANPTDSYSSRNINPEYISRSYSEQASEDELNYFVEGYNPKVAAGNSGYYAGTNNNWNNRNTWNSPWMSPWYGNGFGSRWNNPYMNSMYNPYFGWNDPWMNPYWGGGFNSGWSLSASYFWGNSWGPGWNTWGNPYYGSMWGPSMYYGSGWGWNTWNMGYYRPYTTVVVGGEGSRTNYGKRSTSNSAVVNNVANRNTNTSGARITEGNTGRRTQTADEYYVRPSRRTYTESTSSYSNTGNTYRSSNFNSGSNINRNTGSSSSGFSTPSRSSSSSGGFSTPSRSSSSGSSGSSGSRRGGN
jgi:hypothetical protein